MHVHVRWLEVVLTRLSLLLIVDDLVLSALFNLCQLFSHCTDLVLQTFASLPLHFELLGQEIKLEFELGAGDGDYSRGIPQKAARVCIEGDCAHAIRIELCDCQRLVLLIFILAGFKKDLIQPLLIYRPLIVDVFCLWLFRCNIGLLRMIIEWAGFISKTVLDLSESTSRRHFRLLGHFIHNGTSGCTCMAAPLSDTARADRLLATGD